MTDLMYLEDDKLRTAATKASVTKQNLVDTIIKLKESIRKSDPPVHEGVSNSTVSLASADMNILSDMNKSLTF